MVHAEKVRLSSDGVRSGVPRTNEWRGDDDIYDPWLRISRKQLKIEVVNLVTLYASDNKQAIKIINKGGLNHINRMFFDTFTIKQPEALQELYNTIVKNCTDKVLILFYQVYAHRMADLKNLDLCKEYLIKSIKLAARMPHHSWDKWVVSGYFFLARYSIDQSEKEKYCINCLLKPRTLQFSPHLKLWKIFRAAAWLVVNSEGPEAKRAIKRFNDLKFHGYQELIDDVPVHNWDIKGFINDKRKCLKLFSRGPDRLNGNP